MLAILASRIKFVSQMAAGLQGIVNTTESNRKELSDGLEEMRIIRSETNPHIFLVTMTNDESFEMTEGACSP